jgi:hypothetical protein
MEEKIGKTLEIITSLRDRTSVDEWTPYYTKTIKKGVLLKDKNGFYLQMEQGRCPLYQGGSDLEESFGIKTKYIFHDN